MSGDNDLRSSEGNTNYKAISCEQIPELFLDKMVAKNHFSKFGKIKRFILRPKRLRCTIEYDDKENAKNAYLNAGSFNGIDFIVDYAEHEVAHVQNTEEWVDPEVQAELEAMSPGHRFDPSLSHSIVQKSSMTNRIPKNTNNFMFSPKSIKAVTRNNQNSPQPDFSKLDGMVRQEIEVLLKTPAITDEEKYKVLDARDKLIRLTTFRQTDIKKATATKGTCPDMCPEKERLMREFQRQVYIFEMADAEGCESKISHKKAIKEYSRSSADQEVPLSHELRSESVLQMTMLYLVHRIIGLCDDPKTSLSDWFHFVWDRTRSIRKDITQQELCSLGAVQLVEQCARFHIHCAARLVAEDPSVFDKKINAENLTKCLQTLKYMYHDLRIKGIECPCEPEFRSYIILLNLGDSNFLWEVKQLPKFIQKSAEIKRAITFYNALQNNNFVRFFSMIKLPQTSYLSACILLGYFTKLRVRAMDAIIKSHNWRKNDVYLPLSYLTNILGFDDESSAVSFFNHYGLNCDILDKRVLLDRLIKPNVEYAMDRALQLVESKRQISVGECVFGHALPPTSLFEHHQPHSSFDNNGMLKIESLTTDDHLLEIDVKAKIQPKFKQKQPDEKLASSEVNLFKIPKSAPVISSKQRRSQQFERDQSIVKEIKENSSDSFVIKKEKECHSPVGLQFVGNIFEGTRTLRSKNENIFQAPLSDIKSDQISSTHFESILKSNTENSSMSLDNISGGIPVNHQLKINKIFNSDLRNNENIFKPQQDIPKDILMKEESLQEIQTSKKKSVSLPCDSSKDALRDFEIKIAQNHISGIEMGSGYIVSENNLNEIKLEKLKDVEVKNLRKIQQQQLDNEREVTKLKVILDAKSEQTTELFISQLIEEEVLKLAHNELLTSQTNIKASEDQNELLITEVVKACVEDIANEEYALMCYDQLLLNRYFSRWLMHLRKKKDQRKLIEDTPLWITTDTRAQHAQAIKHPSQHENMKMIKRYRFGQSCDLKDFFKIKCDETENSLNLFALVGQHLLSKQMFTSCGLLQQRKYFKFLITLPGNKEELLGFENFSNKWLTRIIEKCQVETGPFVHGVEHNVALCVRKLNGVIPKNEQGNKMTTEGDHNDGVVCFITGIEIDTNSRKRLYNLLKLTKNLKRVPLAIIAYNCSYNENELADLLDLAVLQEEGLIHSYIILGCQIKRRHFSFRKLFIKAVNFITRESHFLNSNEVQALAMQDILSFLEASLGEEMWQRWCSSTNRNPVFNKIFCLPEHVLGIFHKALDHLLHITQEEFDEMPEFPEELKEFVPENISHNVPLGLEYFPKNWKDNTQKNIIKSFLKTLYLPDINENFPTDTEDLKLWLLNYASKCIKDDDFVAAKASHEAIKNLFDQINYQCLQNLESSSNVCTINYLNVFKPIAFAHINGMLQKFKEKLMNVKVIYLRDDLRNYQTQPWWLNYEPLNSVTIDYTEIPSSLPLKLQNENKLSLVSADGSAKMIAKAEEISREAEESISEVKRRKRISSENTSRSFSSHLKRTLDDSLYQFELSKKVGQYDTSFVTDLTHEIDKTISQVLNASPFTKQKRKISSSIPLDQCSETDKVIAKATKLIQKIENMKGKNV